jgi:hypothetical protein
MLFYIISIICLIIGPALKAQTGENLAIGVNITNNITNLALGNYRYDGGICIEPVFLYKFNEFMNFKAIAGYSKISSEHTLIETYYSNQKLNYINKGAYVKAGIFTGFKKNNKLFYHSFGLSLIYSQFNESGNYTIRGDYFGDLNDNYVVKGQKILFLEPCLDLYIYQNNYFAVLTSIRFPLPLFRSINTDFPNYYIPGYGERATSNLGNINYLYYRFDFFILIPLKRQP